MKKSIILFTIATAGILSSCGGGGNNNSESLSVIPPTPQPVATARTLSCSECSQQEINTLKAAGASINAQAGESIVVQMTLTQAEYGRLVALLNEIRNSKTTTPSPTPPVQPVRTGCYLEYEYGRYEYECDDDDYRATVTTSLSNSQNPRCYYEYENGRQEYECEDERYEIVPQRPTTDGNPTPPLRDGQNPVGCYWDDDEYECYYANGWECEYEHGRWECEYEGRSGLGTRSYYQLPDEGDDAFRGGLSQNIRGLFAKRRGLGRLSLCRRFRIARYALGISRIPVAGRTGGIICGLRISPRKQRRNGGALRQNDGIIFRPVWCGFVCGVFPPDGWIPKCMKTPLCAGILSAFSCATFRAKTFPRIFACAAFCQRTKWQKTNSPPTFTSVKKMRNGKSADFTRRMRTKRKSELTPLIVFDGARQKTKSGGDGMYFFPVVLPEWKIYFWRGFPRSPRHSRESGNPFLPTNPRIHLVFAKKNARKFQN